MKIRPQHPVLCVLSVVLGAMLAGCVAPPPQLPVAELKVPVFVPPPIVYERATSTDRFTLAHGQNVVGEVQVTVASAEDTLPDIARRFNVGYEEIVRANPGVDPWLPGVGREIVLPTAFVLPNAPHEGLVVNIAAMRLFYFPKVAKGAPVIVITHPIGIGRVGWKTPEGVTRITGRQRDPVWTPPESVRREHLDNGDPLPTRVPAGPDNPLGAFLFRLEWPSYLIHGTNKPYGVGMRSSHGCLRLYPEDIAALFESLPIGTKVQVVNQPTVVGARDGVWYTQAFGRLEDDVHARQNLKATAESLRMSIGRQLSTDASEIDWLRVAREAASASGLPQPASGRMEPSIAAAVASARRVANALPAHATWDGRGGTLDDERQYAEMLKDQETVADRR